MMPLLQQKQKIIIFFIKSSSAKVIFRSRQQQKSKKLFLRPLWFEFEFEFADSSQIAADQTKIIFSVWISFSYFLFRSQIISIPPIFIWTTAVSAPWLWIKWHFISLFLWSCIKLKVIESPFLLHDFGTKDNCFNGHV